MLGRNKKQAEKKPESTQPALSEKPKLFSGEKMKELFSNFKEKILKKSSPAKESKTETKSASASSTTKTLITSMPAGKKKISEEERLAQTQKNREHRERLRAQFELEPSAPKKSTPISAKQIGFTAQRLALDFSDSVDKLEAGVKSIAKKN